MKKLLLMCLACVSVPLAALATPYVPADEMTASQGSEGWVAAKPPAPAPMLSYDPLTKYALCAQFITTLQVDDTTSGAYGGMREGEHLLNIIQTDNTSESVWIWSHYYRLMGADTYHDNIDAAWAYCMNNKAYDEEGDDDWITGYYRRYNCGWALRAEMEYRDVYGDNTYAAYADSCASYICHNPMMLNYVTGAPRRLNGMIMAWAVGNLYEYGQSTSNPVFVTKALDMADSLKTWADGNLNKLHWKEWAMDGGVVMWGIVHSMFASDPTGLETWAAGAAPYLDTEVDPSAGAYQNAWRAWAALGQTTASEVLDSNTYGGYFQHLADTLVANDGDLDGGIPVLDADPDNYDQSWVTNYLGFMCMDRLLATAGVLADGRAAGPGLKVSASPVPSVDPPVLRFSLSGSGSVGIRVFDAAGRCVGARDAGVMGVGFHSVSLEDVLAGPCSPGIYFYEVRSGADAARGKMVLLR
jgi:hypothetical protein